MPKLQYVCGLVLQGTERQKYYYFQYHITITTTFQPLNRDVPLASTPTFVAQLRPHFNESLNVNPTLGHYFPYQGSSFQIIETMRG